VEAGAGASRLKRTGISTTEVQDKGQEVEVFGEFGSGLAESVSGRRTGEDYVRAATYPAPELY
jgi:hypothetical protein